MKEERAERKKMWAEEDEKDKTLEDDLHIAEKAADS